ncbi:transcription initiation factor TFIID subunit 11-like [Papaver somniferum]|uniref:transcription initiation factor TFIID subunit 11-like n=1 Tax=Papaver somniferum TaxID=3469 RepID=UPI000E6FA490|nr:transcription initiation factor TFIID subunit 11-like [Papaver somniferum]
MSIILCSWFQRIVTSSSSDYEYSYSSSSSIEDFKASAAKSKTKANHTEGSKPNIPLNDRRVTYAELMKRKAEDDEADDRRHKKDRTRRRILAAEERHRFADGVPSDSDASEDEPVWAPGDRKIKPDHRTKELIDIAKRVEDEVEEDSDDPNIHQDFINGPDSDFDEEEDSEKDNDDESDKSDNFHDHHLHLFTPPGRSREIFAGAKLVTSSSSDYDYSYSSISSDEDFKDSAAKSKTKTNHAEGAKLNIPLNERRVTYAELMKRKAEDDEADDHRRRKDRTRRRIQAVEERRRIDDGVPSDSDAS